MEPNFNEYIYNIFLHLRLMDHCGTGSIQTVRQQKKEFALRICLLGISEPVSQSLMNKVT